MHVATQTAEAPFSLLVLIGFAPVVRPTSGGTRLAAGGASRHWPEQRAAHWLIHRPVI
jgi:hypothetical protein